MFGNNSFGSTSFGSTTFGTGFGTTPTLGAFGSTTQTTPQPAGPTGTTIPFNPLNGTDTVQKTGANAGGPSQISTRHQNISAMKEYESKSVEELRLEDYAANRKVARSPNTFGSTPFSSMQPSTSGTASIFGGATQQTSNNLFGTTPTQNQSTNIFGQPKTVFEGLGNTSSIFSPSLNKPATTVSNSPFAIGSQFNSNPSTSGTQTSGFPLFTPNQTTTTPFGSSAVNSPFKTNMFASPATTTNSIFNSNTNTRTSNFLGANQPSTSTQPAGFGTTTSIFGSTPSSTNTFGTSNIFNTQPKTGFELNNSSSAGTFGSTPKVPNTFGSTPFSSMQPSTSGNTSIFGGTSQQTPNNLFGTTSAQNQSTNIFGQPKTVFEGLGNTSSIFSPSINKPATTVANSPFAIGSQFNSNPATSGTQTSGFPLFTPNQTTTTTFGSSAVNSPFKTNMFASPATTTNSIFNSNTNPGTSSFLSNNQPSTSTQPTGLGTTTSLFGSTPNSTNTFGTSNIFNTQPRTGFELNNSSSAMAQQSPQSSDLLLNRLKTLPYGETSLFLNDTSGFSTGSGSLKFTTDPKTISQYKMKAKTEVKLNKPASSEKTRTNSVLFDGLEDNNSDDLRCAIDVFVPKKNIKKLDLRPNSYLSDGDVEHSISSPPFERSRSSLNSGSMRDSNASPVRHVRYADNTFPGEKTPPVINSSTVSHIPNLSSSNSDLSSFQNTSFNQSSGGSQSHLDTSTLSKRNSSFKCGIISTRPDYKIRPSIEEIERRYSPDSGTCIVNTFLIDRPNYGSILFEFPIDVKGLNLDEIVHIRRKEVVVYPDDENKPPIGQGLNRPAVITLHQVWPIDKSNNEVIKDVDRLNLMRYPEKIESATVEKGARFIEYRPETGSWVFAVKHFSKYGITDDDEDLVQGVISNVQAQNQLLQQQQQSMTQQIPLQQQNPSTYNIQASPQNNGLLLNRLKTPPHPSVTHDSPSTTNGSRSTPLATSNLTINKPQTPQEPRLTSNYRMNPRTNVKLTSKAQSPVEKPKAPSSTLLDSFEEASNYSMRNALDELFDDDDEDDDHAGKKSDGKRSLTVHGTKRLALQNVSPNISTISYERPIIFGAAVPKQQKLREIKVKPDLYAAQNKVSRDIMSVCVSGSPKVRFFSGSRRFCYVHGDSILVHDFKLVPTSSNGSLVEELEEKFETFLEKNSMVTSLNMTPTLAPYIETYDFISNASSYDLLHALYGNLKSKTPYAKQDERLTKVINWLASINRTLPLPTNLYQLIIHHMSCDRYDLASDLAIENNHPRLALLITTLNLDKDRMFEQLSSWRLSTADQYVDTELLKIYILLSGLTEWKLSNDVTIYCLKGLKWTQQLCLLALHVTSFVTEPEKYGFHLLPLYIKRLDTDTNDVDYHILARHSPANIISAAETLVEEWFLLESLKSFHVINSESECINSDIIHCNLASQLGPIDLRWACFVALHIINNEVRNQVLVRCLEQNQDQFENEKKDFSSEALTHMTVESWLVEKLKVPLEFIEQSKALASG